VATYHRRASIRPCRVGPVDGSNPPLHAFLRLTKRRATQRTAERATRVSIGCVLLRRATVAAYQALTLTLPGGGQGNSQGSMLRTNNVDPSNGPAFGGFPGAPQGQQGGGFPFASGRSLILTPAAPQGG
jgi:hypothetical protein